MSKINYIPIPIPLDVFNSELYRSYFYCDNLPIFKYLIEMLYKGANSEYLDWYLCFENTSLENDICIAEHKRNNNKSIISVIKAIINGSNIDTLKKYIELYPLHVNYCDDEHYILSYAIKIRRFAIAKYLIINGSNVNFYDTKGYIPLYYAVINYNINLVTLLLSYGANPNFNCGVENANCFYHALYILSENLTRKSKARRLVKVIALLVKSNTIIQLDKMNNDLLSLLNYLRFINYNATMFLTNQI